MILLTDNDISCLNWMYFTHSIYHTPKSRLIAAFFIAKFPPLARLCGLFFGLNFMRAFRKLALLFGRAKDFPPPFSKFYVTKSGKQYVTKSGNSYVTKGT